MKRYAAQSVAIVLGFFLILLVTRGWSAQDTPAVTGARVGVHDGYTRFVLDLSGKTDFTLYTLADPYRAIIELPAIAWDLAPNAGVRPRGLIQDFRFGHIRQERGRLVIDLSGPATVRSSALLPGGRDKPWRLVIDFAPTSRTAFLAKAGAPKDHDEVKVAKKAPPPAAVEKPEPPPFVKTPGRPLVVIDPGHGGIDPGASAPDGQLEKDIALAVGKVLAETLRKSGRYDALMTREDDVFLKLSERVEFARRVGADLFVSLHADSLAAPLALPNQGVRGMAVYTLSERASDEEADALARKENRADIIAGVDLSGEADDVTLILIDLAQRQTMADSALMGRALTEAIKSSTPLVKNPQRQANFRVLKAPDVPSMLIELGYLTSAEDLARITSPEWQAALAEGLVIAADSHFAPGAPKRTKQVSLP